MPLAADLRNFRNLAGGLRSVLRTRVTLEDAKETIRRRLQERESNFLTTARDCIFSNPTSPYQPLLALAGCKYGDLEQMVRTRGLESTLRKLRDAGVYFTFEEFKGRQPVERAGRLITVSPEQFGNPLQRTELWVHSGGSTGQATRLKSNLSRAHHNATYLVLRHHANGVTDLPKAMWRGLMPIELNGLLASAIIEDLPERWFTPHKPFDFTAARRYPFATYAVLALSRLYGTKLPWPELVPLDQAVQVARWAADASRKRGGCYVTATASLSLRVAVAAQDHGLDLSGTVFSGGGEPLTPAKAAGIEAVGATSRPGYFAAETGPIGMGCASPGEPNEQHLLDDKLGTIQVSRPIPGFNQRVDAFNFTTLLPNATNILLNLELDDFGVVDTRSCGCLFESLGLTRHVRQIRSFRKLTGEGVCLVGSDMCRILEEVLPERFGGSALDYQLSEDENERGFTRLTLIVSPRVPVPSSEAVTETVLNALAATNASGDYARVTWQQAGTFRVVRAEPEWTAAGKLPTLRRATPAKTQ